MLLAPESMACLHGRKNGCERSRKLPVRTNWKHLLCVLCAPCFPICPYSDRIGPGAPRASKMTEGPESSTNDCCGPSAVWRSVPVISDTSKTSVPAARKRFDRLQSTLVLDAALPAVRGLETTKATLLGPHRRQATTSTSREKLERRWANAVRGDCQRRTSGQTSRSVSGG
jgi:hypothetical protein